VRSILRGLAISALATIIAGAVVWLIAKATGTVAIGRAFDHVHAPWIIGVAAAELLTYPAYTIAYRSLAQVHGEEPMSHAMAARIVVAGFGPFALLGGFGFDKQALSVVHDDERGARVKVMALGALEWAVLAPVGCACAIALLLGDASIMGSLLWPWAIAVPVGFAVAAWTSSPDRIKRLSTFRGRTIRPLAETLDGVASLRTLVLHPVEYRRAWLGTTFYWAFDIFSFYAAARMFGIRLNLGATVIAYASGYAVTRRSLPLGGAGLTELLMTYSLYWVGASLAPALAAVLVYRLFNFVLVGGPAVVAQRQLERMFDAKLNPGPAVPAAVSPKRIRDRLRGRVRSRARR
jgi:uncharacterized membrane protein YbhN (UPF0104 family)